MYFNHFTPTGKARGGAKNLYVKKSKKIYFLGCNLGNVGQKCNKKKKIRQIFAFAPLGKNSGNAHDCSCKVLIFSTRKMF